MNSAEKEERRKHKKGQTGKKKKKEDVGEENRKEKKEEGEEDDVMAWGQEQVWNKVSCWRVIKRPFARFDVTRVFLESLSSYHTM